MAKVLLFISACWLWAQIDRHKKRNELVESILALKRISGEREDIVYAVDKLMDDHEYLIQLMNGGIDVTFGAGGSLTVSEMPDFQITDNICIVTLAKRKLEFMRLDNGKNKVLRVTEIGSRGASRTVLELDVWVLLQILSRLGLVREEYDLDKI